MNPPQRDGDDLGAGCLDGGGIRLEALVLAGADDQPRSEGPPGDGPGIGLDVLLCSHSAASDKMHDFINIAVRDTDFAQARPCDNLEVAFDRDLRGIESDLNEHPGHAQSGWHPPMLAVDLDSHTYVDTHCGFPIGAA